MSEERESRLGILQQKLPKDAYQALLAKRAMLEAKSADTLTGQTALDVELDQQIAMIPAYRTRAGYDEFKRALGVDPEQARRFENYGVILQPKQWLFSYWARQCDLPDGPEEVGTGGARGPGKSFSLMAQTALDDCQRFDGLKVLFLRFTAKAAKEQMRDLAIKILRRMPDAEVYKDRIDFPNGSQIVIGGFSNEGQALSYSGIENDILIVEEATQLSAKTHEVLRATNRSSKRFNGVPWRPRRYFSTNPLGIGHCVPYGEVLTPYGWIDIRNLHQGDPVYTVNPCGEMVETTVDQTHAYFHDGDMIEVSARGLSIVCTPNHSIAKIVGIRGKGRNALYTLMPFDELPGDATILRQVDWHGTSIGTITLDADHKKRKSRTPQPLSMTGEQYAAFMGWFLSEGHCNTVSNHIAISQIKLNGRDLIRDLLDSIGFTYHEHDDGFHIYSREWSQYLAHFGKCREKSIPFQLRNSTQTELRALFNALVDGDGHWVGGRGTSGQYYTISPFLADDVAEIAVKLGYQVLLSHRQRENREGLSYCVNFKKTASMGSRLNTGQHRYAVSSKTSLLSSIEHKPYKGMVYCIGIEDTHTFILRQNGSVWVSGNSAFKKRFVDNERKREKGQLFDPREKFIFASVYDNAFINPEYIGVLQGYTGIQRRAYLDGNWDVSAGAYFTEFDYDTHVIPPFYDVSWLRRVWASMDFGFNHWNVCQLHGADGDGVIYTLDELRHRGRYPEEIGPDIKAWLDKYSLTPGQLECFLVGSDAFSQTGRSRFNIAQQYSSQGIHLSRAETGPGSRISGALELSRLLGTVGNSDVDLRRNRVAMLPRWYITSNCEGLIECLSYLEHDPNNSEDILKVDTDEEGNGGDDDIDCARYAIYRPHVTSIAGS